MIGISGGIEPIFNLSYTRKTESLHGEDVYYTVFTKIAKDYMDKHNLTKLEELPDFFVTTQSLNPLMRVKMQSIWQKHIDASISSTVNLPNEATVEEVENIYLSAWENGLKGLTIYRDGCARQGILTTSKDKKDDNEEEQIGLKRGQWKSLAEDTYYVKRNITIGCGKLKLFIGWSPSEMQIQDLYVVKSGKGGCSKNLQALCISMSAVLRLGGSIELLEKAFTGIDACPSFARERAKGVKLSNGSYCGSAIINEINKFLKEPEHDGVLKGLKKMIAVSNKEKEIVIEVIDESDETIKEDNNSKFTEEELTFIKENGETAFAIEFHKCPTCGDKIVHVGGCIQCNSCGYTKCD